MYKNELPFLNVIRGSSALLVLFFHFFVFFFTDQDMSAGLINAEPLDLVDPAYLSYVLAIPFNIGHLGVAFFFLMSGFFIQPSLEKYNLVRPFLVHKFLRLWPSYAFCFALGLVFVFIFSQLREDIFPYSFDHMFAYFFWTRDIFHYAYIDGSVWSLEIQVKFYIFAAIVWYFWRHRFLEAMTVSFLVLCAMGFVLREYGEFEESSYRYLVYNFNKDIKYSLLITMGVCYYSYYNKKISLLKFILLGFLLLGCFVSPLAQYSRPYLMNAYYLGIFLFGCSLFFTNIKQKSSTYAGKTMDWFAKISYPLYVCQVLPGYTIIYYMLEKGYNVYLALFTALAVVFPIAYFAHEKIEKVFSRIRIEPSK
ncbi:MAG: acyltransferase [Alphaproteobacteria bacterium]|nr:acyltransferase [Alphaproteobacteria bacterium]